MSKIYYLIDVINKYWENQTELLRNEINNTLLLKLGIEFFDEFDNSNMNFSNMINKFLKNLNIGDFVDLNQEENSRNLDLRIVNNKKMLIPFMSYEDFNYSLWNEFPRKKQQSIKKLFSNTYLEDILLKHCDDDDDDNYLLEDDE